MPGERVSTIDDDALFAEFARTGRRSLRNELIERHMGLAAHVAKRFSRSNVADEDLRQVAMLGLVKAVDRFDPHHGSSFSSFAGLTIEGELKRHFRDRSWSVKVPRSAKDLHLLVRRTSDELAQRHGRSPSVDEIAEAAAIDRDDVLRGLEATAAYNVGTLDTGDTDDHRDDRQPALAAREPGFERTDDRHVIGELLARLPEREREIVRLRFYEERSQSDIAAIVGVSQMHVSRLLRRSFEQMRSWMEDGADRSRPAPGGGADPSG